MSRPQNFDSRSLRILTYLTYFVSCFAKSSTGGISWSSDNRTTSPRAAIDRDGSWSRVQVAGLAIPLLSFPFVRRQLHDVSVAPAERFVTIDERLHAVRAARQVGDRAARVPERACVDDACFAGLPSVDVDAEYLLRAGCIADLKARLVRGVGGDEDEQPAIQRRAAPFGGKRNLEAKPGGLGLWVYASREQGEQRGTTNTERATSRMAAPRG